MFYSIGERTPRIRGEYFLAPGARVIGSVDLGENTSIWFNAVVRADNDWVVIGEQTNIQDGCVLHVDPGVPLHIGKRVVVGHQAMLHGCTVGDDSLIGINAVVLNGARIGRHCLIGANTLITEGTVIPDGSLVMGSPGRVVRSLTEQERETLALGGPQYAEHAAHYREHLKPLHEPGPTGADSAP